MQKKTKNAVSMFITHNLCCKVFVQKRHAILNNLWNTLEIPVLDEDSWRMTIIFYLIRHNIIAIPDRKILVKGAFNKIKKTKSITKDKQLSTLKDVNIILDNTIDLNTTTR